MHLTCCGRMTVSVGHHTRSVGLSFVCNSQTTSESEAVAEVSVTMPGISYHDRDWLPCQGLVTIPWISYHARD